MTQSMLESILLINLRELNELTQDKESKGRRRALEQDDFNEVSAPTLPDSLASAFEATHEPPLETNDNLTETLADAFQDVSAPTFNEFKNSVDELVRFKNNVNLTNKSFLSAAKSLISSVILGQVEILVPITTWLYLYTTQSYL